MFKIDIDNGSGIKVKKKKNKFSPSYTMVDTPVPPVIVLEAGVWLRAAAMMYEAAPNVNSRAEITWRVEWPRLTASHRMTANLYAV